MSKNKPLKVLKMKQNVINLDIIRKARNVRTSHGMACANKYCKCLCKQRSGGIRGNVRDKSGVMYRRFHSTHVLPGEFLNNAENCIKVTKVMYIIRVSTLISYLLT